MQSGELDGGGVVVAGGKTAPLLELVDAPLDGVSLLVRLAVESWRPAAKAASALAVGGLAAGCGISARILRRRRCSRLARDE